MSADERRLAQMRREGRGIKHAELLVLLLVFLGGFGLLVVAGFELVVAFHGVAAGAVAGAVDGWICLGSSRECEGS